MKTTSETRDPEEGDAVEMLLKKASPRPAPPDDVESEIRQAVRREWEAVTRGRRRQRRVARIAVAASVVLAAAILLSTLQGTRSPTAEVATIARAHGTISLESKRSGEVPAEPLTSITTEHVMMTAEDSAAALNWGSGGSLRVDENTRIEFRSTREVYLHSGRLYYDSGGAPADRQLVILTTHGSVQHVGTQFMTESRPSRLVVSVREGRVEIDGTYRDQTAFEGQIIELTGDAPARVTNTRGIGKEWEWTERVAPMVEMDGRSTYEFLHWVGRETGHNVVFSTESAEALARSTLFVGDIKGNPRSDLRLWMMTTDLEAHFDADGPSLTVTISR